MDTDVDSPSKIVTREAITLSNVTMTYKTKEHEVIALEDVNAQFPAGKISCLLGPSGCGKSTILKLIAGFEHSTSGTIEANGAPIGPPSPDRSMVFQSPALFPWLTVWDNVVFGPKRQGIDKRKRTADAGELIGIAGLSGFANYYPYQLSGGMRQRVQIVRSLISRPGILLMDEPFGALDAQTRTDMQEYFLTLADLYHPTVVFVTHDVEEALLVGDRVFVMTPRPGKIAQIVDVPLSKPRDRSSVTSREFVSLRQEVMSYLVRDSAVSSGKPSDPLSSSE